MHQIRGDSACNPQFCFEFFSAAPEQPAAHTNPRTNPPVCGAQRSSFSFPSRFAIISLYRLAFALSPPLFRFASGDYLFLLVAPAGLLHRNIHKKSSFTLDALQFKPFAFHHGTDKVESESMLAKFNPFSFNQYKEMGRISFHFTVARLWVHNINIYVVQYSIKIGLFITPSSLFQFQNK